MTSIPEVYTLLEEDQGACLGPCNCASHIDACNAELASLVSPMASWFQSLVKQPSAANFYKSFNPEEEIRIERYLIQIDTSSNAAIKHQITALQSLHGHPAVVQLKVGP